MILAAQHPDFAEWYSENIYPLIVTSIGRLWGILPFSASELGLYILIAAFLLSLGVMVKNVIKSKREAWGSWLSGVLLAVGILAFLYTACCGINYHRRPFSEEEGIITYQYSADDLKEICVWLTEEVNARADTVTRDADGLLTLDGS